MAKILCIDPKGFSNEARAILRRAGTLVEKSLTRQQLVSQIGNYDGLFLRFAHRIDEDLLARASRLKVIGCNATGVDHIDVPTAEKLGIRILSLKNETAFLKKVSATAEHTWGLLLALIRHTPRAFASVQTRRWERDLFVGNELSGKRLGIVGFGRIGQMVARYGKAFSMNVHVFTLKPHLKSPGVRFHQNLKSLLRQSDILTLHVPLNSETEEMLGRKELSLLPQGAFLINTSRGAVIDEVALLQALTSGKLAGAAIDVMKGETPSGFSSRHPLIRYARNRSNLLITPHIGGAAWEAWQKTEVFIAQKMVAYLKSFQKR